MNSYSQYGEDTLVAQIFGDYKGLLLEIGAWAVKDFSNSRAFIEDGWEAVLVEFSPMPVHSLVKEYGYNEKVKIIQAAITAGPESTPGSTTEFDITENALSTANHDMKVRWADAKVNYYGTLWVPTLTLLALTHQFFSERIPDYVSIDTEGTSADLALELLRRKDFRPRVLIVEYDGKLDEIVERGAEAGYRKESVNETNVVLVLA